MNKFDLNSGNPFDFSPVLLCFPRSPRVPPAPGRTPGGHGGCPRRKGAEVAGSGAAGRCRARCGRGAALWPSVEAVCGQRSAAGGGSAAAGSRLRAPQRRREGARGFAAPAPAAAPAAPAAAQRGVRCRGRGGPVSPRDGEPGRGAVAAGAAAQPRVRAAAPELEAAFPKREYLQFGPVLCDCSRETKPSPVSSIRSQPSGTSYPPFSGIPLGAEPGALRIPPSDAAARRPAPSLRAFPLPSSCSALSKSCCSVNSVSYLFIGAIRQQFAVAIGTGFTALLFLLP